VVILFTMACGVVFGQEQVDKIIMAVRLGTISRQEASSRLQQYLASSEQASVRLAAARGLGMIRDPNTAFGLTSFIDCWPLHTGGGEIHCGTNGVRSITQ